MFPFVDVGLWCNLKLHLPSVSTTVKKSMNISKCMCTEGQMNGGTVYAWQIFHSLCHIPAFIPNVKPKTFPFYALYKIEFCHTKRPRKFEKLGCSKFEVKIRRQIISSFQRPTMHVELNTSLYRNSVNIWRNRIIETLRSWVYKYTKLLCIEKGCVRHEQLLPAHPYFWFDWKIR